MIMRLRCERCRRRFEHEPRRGPFPKYCSGACRQAAFRARHANDGLGRDPRTPAEWQEAVDGAHMMLLIDSAVLYGLIETDMRINVPRCEEVLEAGAVLGYTPRPTDELIREWFA